MRLRKRFQLVVALASTTLFPDIKAQDPSQSGQLTAGEIDDNLNFEAFLSYKERALRAEQQGSILPNPALSDRISLQVRDSGGNPFSSAIVEIQDDKGQLRSELPAGTNGKISLFPSLDTPSVGDGSTIPWRIVARAPGGLCPAECSNVTDIFSFNDQGNASIEIPSTSSLPSKLDLALVVDTTGSMCDELEYLQSELKAVISSVVQGQGGNVDVKVGIVAYRDHDDAYVVETTSFAASDDAVNALTGVTCGGGGDYPEAMDEAMESAAALEWRPGNVARVLFLVADAPPHDENLQRTLSAALDLRKKGVRAYGVAASGVADTAEYLMRLMALLTGARYAWLTDDSGIGGSHAEPKVMCYQVTRLDSLLKRVLGSELRGERVEAHPEEIVRETGKQEGGICIIDVDPEEESQSPTPSPTSSPVGGGGFGDDVGPGSFPSPGDGTISGKGVTIMADDGASETSMETRSGACAEVASHVIGFLAIAVACFVSTF